MTTSFTLERTRFHELLHDYVMSSFDGSQEIADKLIQFKIAWVAEDDATGDRIEYLVSDSIKPYSGDLSRKFTSYFVGCVARQRELEFFLDFYPLVTCLLVPQGESSHLYQKMFRSGRTCGEVLIREAKNFRRAKGFASFMTSLSPIRKEWKDTAMSWAESKTQRILDRFFLEDFDHESWLQWYAAPLFTSYRRFSGAFAKFDSERDAYNHLCCEYSMLRDKIKSP